MQSNVRQKAWNVRRGSKQFRVLWVCPKINNNNNNNKTIHIVPLYSEKHSESTFYVYSRSPKMGSQLTTNLNYIFAHLFLTGKQFFHEVGYLGLSEKGESSFVHQLKRNALKAGVQFAIFDSGDLEQMYPYMKLPPGTQGILLKEMSGYINPRKLVIAQQKIARKLGAILYSGIVNKIDKDRTGVYTLRLQSGDSLHSKKILLTPGAFIEIRELLPTGINPDMNSTTETVLFVSWLNCKYIIDSEKGTTDLENGLINRQYRRYIGESLHHYWQYMSSSGTSHVQACKHEARGVSVPTLPDRKSFE